MKYLGIDFGLRRIGLATSDGSLASPYETLKIKGLRDAVDRVMKIVQKEETEKVIVGLPEGKMGKTVLGFVNALKKTGLDVTVADETLSSQKAISRMIEENIPKEKRKMNDATAAAIILQNWLDEQT